MADSSFRAGGLASGLDSNSIIEKLIELESRPIQLMQQRQSGIKTQISKLAEIRSKLSDLTTAARALSTGGTVATKVSSTHTGFDGVVGAGAVAGRHTVQVSALATAAAARSQGFASASSQVRGGSLAFTVQGKDYNITIADGTALSDVAFQLRQTGAPISATVVSDGSQYYLSVMNNQTGNPTSGVALAMVETTTGGLGQALTADATNLVVRNAQNASLTVDGLPMTRQSNSVGDVIPGVTLNLKAEGGAEETIVISNDIEGTKTNLQKFVDAYNAAQSMVQTQLTSTPGSDRSATLAGDPSMRSLQAAMQKLITSEVGTGPIRSLADIGVKTGRDGTLSVDSATLTKALTSDANAVNELFANATTGLFKITETTVNRYGNISDGILVTRSKGLQSSITKMDTLIESMKLRVEGRRTQLINQFTAMEKVVSTMRSTGNFLNGLNSAGGAAT
ncbi:MAG TPA: flagellar filament capping protein FliD [Polyangia bacterium]